VQDLGVTLVHEHVLVDWIGADRTTPDRYDRDEVVAVALPHLERARELGVRTLFDCTPAYLGRDVRVLERLARETGMHILANTGYYGAADDRYVPAHAHEASAEELAATWVREREQGIDGTGIRPAFMKIGVDPGPLSPIDGKLVEAAAIAHHATGMAIHSHTGDSVAGLAQLDLLERRGVPLDRFVWVHAQNAGDVAILIGAAERGAWIELDGVAPGTVQRHAELVAIGVQAEVIAMSDEIGLFKPDPAFFARTLELIGSPDPGGVAYVGDRIDNDILPAIAAGMPAVWIRRGPWGVIQQMPGGVTPALTVMTLGELVTRIGEVWGQPPTCGGTSRRSRGR
jgi:phosphotriesterase-related protein